MAAPTLRELQHQLEAVFGAGHRDDAEAIVERAAPTLPIGGDARLRPAERVGIYTRMIFVRVRDAMAEDFPATFAVLGDERWEGLVSRYLAAHPTDHPDLRLAPRHLPRFVRETESTPLADLVELEWALAESFTAADASLLTTDALQSLAPEEWPTLEVRSVPSLRLLSPESPSDLVRRDLLDGSAVDLEACDPFGLRVWRRDLRVFLKRIEPFEQAALRQAQSGVAFADLCAWIAEVAPERDASEAAVGLLRAWLTDELLVDPR